MTFNGFKKFYVNDTCTEFFWGKVVDGTTYIDFQMLMDALFIEASRRGLPWKCLLARGIIVASENDRTLFPFVVKYCYVEGSMCYLFSVKRPTERNPHPVALAFRHNFTKTLRQFDRISKAQFIELFGDAGVNIRLRPPRRQHHDEDRDPGRPQPHRRRTEREAGERRIVGARKRALDAGLLDMFMLGGERPTA
jgi:hypothetical protein